MLKRYEIELEFLTPILGSQPADPDLLTAYIASKSPNIENGTEEEDIARDRADEFGGEKGLTVFPCDEKGIFLYDYQVKGFIKEAANVLKDTLKAKNYRSKVDNYLFVEPRRIHLKRENQYLEEEDYIHERPLRAMTMMGPRVTLVGSELLEMPLSCKFEMVILDNAQKVEWDNVQKLLDYGKFKGLGQWRNGGWGKFTWSGKEV